MKEDVKILGKGFLTAHPIFNPVYVLSFLSIMLTTFRSVPVQEIKGAFNTHGTSVRTEAPVFPKFRDIKSETGFGVTPPDSDGKFYATTVTATASNVLYIVKEGMGGGTVLAAPGNTISWKGPVGKIGALKQGQKLSIMATASSQSVISSWNGCNTVTGSDCAAIFSPGKVITIKFEKVKK